MAKGIDVTRKGKGSLNVKKKVIVFCEGENTEPTYIKCLKNKNLHIENLIPTTPYIFNGITNGKVFADECITQFKIWVKKNDLSKVDSVWMVFDDDEHPNLQVIFKLQPKDYGDKRLRVVCAFSSMCIEYWILLHFRDHNGDAIYQTCDKDHSERIIKMINKEITKYNNTHTDKLREYDKSKKWLEDNFEFFLKTNEDNPCRFLEKKPRIVEAYHRAKALHKKKQDIGKEFEESVTTFYKLLEYLGVVCERVLDREDGMWYDVKEKDDTLFYVKHNISIFIDTRKEKIEPFLREKE